MKERKKEKNCNFLLFLYVMTFFVLEDMYLHRQVY